MSAVVPREAIQVIAQSIGVPNLSPDVANSLAPDVEYRLREIMQEAIKCMRHSRRTTLMVDDVDCALNLRNVEPIYGFASGGPLRFKRAPGHRDLFYINDKDVEFKDVIDTPLPKAPLATSVSAHWLAIEGVQPAVPENTLVEATSNGKKLEYKEDGLPVVKHVLSKELQLYFEKITEFALGRSDSSLFRKAAVSLETDSGLQPLVPYFTCFIADEVTKNLGSSRVLFALMRMARCLLQNTHIHVEPYLHQLMPSIVTCIVAKCLGNKVTDNHWDLRDFAAGVMALTCKKFGHMYHNLQPRVTRTLLHAFLDPTKTLAQNYGAIQGLAALGQNAVRQLILPNLEAYMQLLAPEMLVERQRNQFKRQEAWRVYGALMLAAGVCIYDQLKTVPVLLSPPSCTVWKNSEKCRGALQNKRKASMDNLMQQPPPKKIAAENTARMMPVQMHGTSASLTTVERFSNAAMSSMPRQVSSSLLGREACGENIRPVSVLSRAWKDDIDAGHILASLIDLFGETMFLFTPKPELGLFL